MLETRRQKKRRFLKNYGEQEATNGKMKLSRGNSHGLKIDIQGADD
jgi:hypothetical protein